MQIVKYIPVDEKKLNDISKENKGVIVFDADEVISFSNKSILTREVIVKRFFNCDKETKFNIAREAKALSEMKMLTPFLPSFINIVEQGNNVDLVMEKIEGETLESYIDKNSLSIDDRLKLFIKICKIVEILHNNGYKHRDLKPQNIILHFASKKMNDIKDIQPYLIDFGSSLLLENYHIGTAKYKAPEIDTNKRDSLITNKVDVYSMGVILIRFLTKENIINIKPRIFDHLNLQNFEKNRSDLLDNLVKNMLSINPNERPDMKTIILKLRNIVEWKN